MVSIFIYLFFILLAGLDWTGLGSQFCESIISAWEMVSRVLRPLPCEMHHRTRQILSHPFNLTMSLAPSRALTLLNISEGNRSYLVEL
ncbi:hypothetical protein BDV18DRAFT_67981 [Aspergillus unguis]